MLVYCNELFLVPDKGIAPIVACVARWLGEKSRGFVDPAALVKVGRLRLNDGATVEVVTNQLDPSSAVLPLLLCIRLTHGDDVAGRQWVTEIGIERHKEGGPFRCTILLQTNEISARVNVPISVTRPRIVGSLVESCSPVETTPGLYLKGLTEDTADLFGRLIEDENRITPIILVSPTMDGQYLTDLDQLKAAVCGLAQTFVIPTTENTYAITEILGTRYSAWRGGIKVIFPARSNSRSIYSEVQSLHPDFLIDLLKKAGRTDHEILSIVTHRTNLPLSWSALSFAKVDLARRQAEFAQASRNVAEAPNKTSDEILQLAFDEIKEKEVYIESLRGLVLDRDNDIRNLEYQIESLKYSLAKKDGRGAERDAVFTENIYAALRHLSLKGGTVMEALTIAAAFFPDRIVVLESAFESAKGSGVFRFVEKAFELLFTLATDYWVDMKNGTGNHQAKNVFGNAYAAAEAKSLSREGRGRRTFLYNGDRVEMMQHLKIGIADNAADTLRIHFHWDADEQMVIIGYCGPHLDF